MNDQCFCDNVPKVWRLTGVTRTLRLRIFNPDGTPLDLTGRTVAVTIARDNSEFVYAPGFVIEGDDNNVVKFEWPADKQGAGDYTINVTTTDGSGNVDRVNWHGPTGIRLVDFSFMVRGEDALGVTSEANIGLDGTFTMNGTGMSAYDEWLAEGHTGTPEDFIAWLRQPAVDAASAAEAQMGQIQERADADHTRAGNDHTTAGQDHTRAGNDHTTAASDHGTAADDHTLAVSDHGTAADDHTTAGNDHTRAQADHGIAADDHTRAGQDHQTASDDHTQAGSDHTRAGEDHTRAGDDHQTASSDHTRAGEDHTTAGSDHTRAGEDHTQAGNDHTRAEADHGIAADDHTQATADHAVMAGYDTRLGNVEDEVSQLGQYVLNSFFVGAGTTYKSVRLNGLKPGSKYRVTLFNPDYNTSDIPSGLGYLFSINSWHNNQQTFIAGTGAARPEYYDITIPSDSEYIVIGGRANAGVEVLFNIQDLDVLSTRVVPGLGVSDLSITDDNGNAIVTFSGGHVRTNSFDSKDVKGLVETQKATPRLKAGGSDLSIVDESGNVLARFSNGGLETLNFNGIDTQKQVAYMMDIITRNFPERQSGQYTGEKIQINKNVFNDDTWKTFTGLPITQSFATHGDYIVFVYGSSNYGSGSLWKISTRTKIADLTFPHTGFEAPHGNVVNFSKSFADGNTDLPLLYISQWDNEGGCFVYDIQLDGSVNLVQTIMTDGNMGEEFGLALGDWVLDVENGFIWSAKYKESAYHTTGNGMMFCKFNIPSTANASVILTASDILDSFEIDDKTADLTVTQDKVINSGKMFIACGFGDSQYPGRLYVIDLLGKKLSAFLNITALHSGEPEGLDIFEDKLLYAFGGTTIYSLTF